MEGSPCLLRVSAVMARCAISRSQVYRLLDLGQFPKPVKISERSVRWRSDEVQDWIEQRTLDRNHQSPDQG